MGALTWGTGVHHRMDALGHDAVTSVRHATRHPHVREAGIGPVPRGPHGVTQFVQLEAGLGIDYRTRRSCGLVASDAGVHRILSKL